MNDIVPFIQWDVIYMV